VDTKILGPVLDDVLAAGLLCDHYLCVLAKLFTSDHLCLLQ